MLFWDLSHIKNTGPHLSTLKGPLHQMCKAQVAKPLIVYVLPWQQNIPS